MSKAALEKQKAAAKKKAKKQEDDAYEDDENDAYTALSESRSLWANESANPKPPVGSLEKCAKCSKQFTVAITVVLQKYMQRSSGEVHGLQWTMDWTGE